MAGRPLRRARENPAIWDPHLAVGALVSPGNRDSAARSLKLLYTYDGAETLYKKLVLLRQYDQAGFDRKVREVRTKIRTLPGRKNNPSGARPSRTPYYGAKPQMDRKASIREQMEELPAIPGLPLASTLKQKRKAVIGGEGYGGGLWLTPEGESAFREMTGGDDWFQTRHHPALLWLAENRPQYFIGGTRIVDVPGGVYAIREYDGWETLYTPQSVNWIHIEGVQSNPRRR